MFEQNRKYFLKYIKNNTEIITKLENFEYTGYRGKRVFSGKDKSRRLYLQ